MFFLFPGFSLFAQDIYVSPKAQSGGDGSAERPYSSMEEAQEIIRDKVGKGNLSVWLMDGTYYKAMKLAQQLIAHERELLENVT